MNVCIVEDELASVEAIQSLLNQYDPEISVIDTISSVKGAVQWLKTNPSPDLIIIDVKLNDGLCFDIFEQIEVTSPVIFTTAYDDFVLEAFKVNSVDYLLKPVKFEALEKSLNKFKLYHGTTKYDLSKLRSDIRKKNYQSRFISKLKNNIYVIPCDDILYFFAKYRGVYVVTKSGQKYLIQYKLSQIEHLIDPGSFFRLNRKYITAYQAIEKVQTYSSSRILVELMHCDDKVLVPREKVMAFKEWLEF